MISLNMLCYWGSFPSGLGWVFYISPQTSVPEVAVVSLCIIHWYARYIMSWKIEFEIICFLENLYLEIQVSGLLEKFWCLELYCGCWLLNCLGYGPLIIGQNTRFCLFSFGDWRAFYRIQNAIILWGQGGVPFLWHMQKNMTGSSKYLPNIICCYRTLSLFLFSIALQRSRADQS